MVEQRRCSGLKAALLYFTDKYGVVTLIITAAIKAFETRCCAFNERCAGNSIAKLYAVKAVAWWPRKLQRQRLLVGTEHIDGVMRSIPKSRECARAVCQTPKHQRGAERDGVK